MAVEYEIIDITPENVDEYDMLCVKSKKSSEGYQNKLKWFHARYAEGLRMKLLWVNDGGKMTSRGFIEYIPGEYTWRAVEAEGYNVIHCIWVVGKWKKKGLGHQLLQTCVNDSRSTGKKGVVFVASEGTWLAGKKVFLKNGFELIETTPPSFSLLVHKLAEHPDARFPTDWEKRAERFGDGLTVVYTDQCPYQPGGVAKVQEFAEEQAIAFKKVRFETAEEARQRSPSPYGVFSIIYNGKLISYTYEKKKKLAQLIK